MNPNNDNNNMLLLKRMAKHVSEMHVYFKDDDFKDLLREFRRYGNFRYCTQSFNFHQGARDLVARYLQKLYCLFNHFKEQKMDQLAADINQKAKMLLDKLMELLVLTHNHHTRELAEASKFNFEHRSISWLIITGMVGSQMAEYDENESYYDQYMDCFGTAWKVWVNDCHLSFPCLENLNKDAIVNEWNTHGQITHLGKDSGAALDFRKILCNLAKETFCFVERMKCTRNGERDKLKLMERFEKAMLIMIFILKNTGNTNATELTLLADKHWKLWMLAVDLLWNGHEMEFDVWNMVQIYSLLEAGIPSAILKV